MGDLNLNKYTALCIAFLVIISNVVIGHFFAPAGIFLSPVMTTIAAISIILNKDNFDIILQAILMFALVAVNDIGIKLYGGGIHDSEGQGVLNMFFFICLMPCFIILFILAIKKDITVFKKITSVAIFLILTMLHLHFFSLLGLERSYL